MAVDLNATKRQRALDSLAQSSARTWATGTGQNRLAYTITNPRLRESGGHPVFTVEVRVTRGGVLVHDDQINMPNPPQAVWVGDTIVDNPQQALRDTIRDVVNITTKGFTRPRLERLPDGTFRGDTLAVRDDTADGRVNSSDATFATMAAGAALVAQTTEASQAEEWRLDAGPLYSGQFFFHQYDTSSIPDGAASSITAAVYTLYGTGTAESDADNYNMEVRYKDWGGTVTTGDWFDPSGGVWNALVSGGSLDVGSWNQTSGTANNYSDSGVYTSISKTGTTRVVSGLSGMNASTPTGVNSVTHRTANQAGTSADPLLTVTYTIVVTSVAATATATATNPVPKIAPTDVAATATATAPAPVPHVKVTSVAATASATAVAPAVSITGGDVNIADVAATATATAVAPAATIAPNDAVATATADAIAPSPTIAPADVAATATATALAPGTSITQPTVAATATADAKAPVPTISMGGIVATATAVANAPVPVITLPTVAATATATAPAPVPTLLIIPPPATATATAIAPTLFISVAPADLLIDIHRKYQVSVHLPNVEDLDLEIGQPYELEMRVMPEYGLELRMSHTVVYIGTSVETTGTFTTVETGDPVDPTTITGATRSPTGLVTEYVYGVAAEMGKDSTGVYTLTFTPTSEGVWTVAMQGEGAAVAVNQDTFRALPSILS